MAPERVSRDKPVGRIPESTEYRRLAWPPLFDGVLGVMAPTVEYVAGLLEYANAVGAVSFTVITTVSVSKPPVFNTLITELKLPIAVAVPVIEPVSVSNERPVGNAPESTE